MEKTYWNKTSDNQEAYDTLWAALVPSSGKCESVQGELLRAATRIYYDLYNNGFGNNWSGAWNFLISCNNLLINDDALKTALGQVSEYRRGRVVYGRNEALYGAVEAIVDRVVVYVVGHSYLTPNVRDMFDMSEEDDYEDYSEEFEESY